MKRFFLCLVAVALMFVFGAVSAQENTLPAYLVFEIIPGESVTLISKNFPAEMEYIVSMSEEGETFSDVARFNSGRGGIFLLKIHVPHLLRETPVIYLNLTDANGAVIAGNFLNLPPDESIDDEGEVLPTEEALPEDILAEIAEMAENGEIENPEATEEVLPAVEAEPICDYSVIPTFDVTDVVRGKSVTVVTKDFPANKLFKVMMGDYADMGSYAYLNNPCFNCGPAPLLFFKGTEIASYATGDGASQTVTFDIPEEMKDYSAVILWFDEVGDCGFYSYSLVWNTDTAPVPTSAPTAEMNSEQ